VEHIRASVGEAEIVDPDGRVVGRHVVSVCRSASHVAGLGQLLARLLTWLEAFGSDSRGRAQRGGLRRHSQSVLGNRRRRSVEATRCGRTEPGSGVLSFIMRSDVERCATQSDCGVIAEATSQGQRGSSVLS
jgi:hypothetical protein